MNRCLRLVRLLQRCECLIVTAESIERLRERKQVIVLALLLVAAISELAIDASRGSWSPSRCASLPFTARTSKSGLRRLRRDQQRIELRAARRRAGSCVPAQARSADAPTRGAWILARHGERCLRGPGLSQVHQQNGELCDQLGRESVEMRPVRERTRAFVRARGFVAGDAVLVRDLGITRREPVCLGQHRSRGLEIVAIEMQQADVVMKVRGLVAQHGGRWYASSAGCSWPAARSAVPRFPQCDRSCGCSRVSSANRCAASAYLPCALSAIATRFSATASPGRESSTSRPTRSAISARPCCSSV